MKLYHQIESVEVFIKAFNDTVEKEIRYRGNQCGKEYRFRAFEDENSISLSRLEFSAPYVLKILVH